MAAGKNLRRHKGERISGKLVTVNRRKTDEELWYHDETEHLNQKDVSFYIESNIRERNFVKQGSLCFYAQPGATNSGEAGRRRSRM